MTMYAFRCNVLQLKQPLSIHRSVGMHSPRPINSIELAGPFRIAARSAASRVNSPSKDTNHIEYKNFSFDIIYTTPSDSSLKDGGMRRSRARVGKLNTPHGTINTPNFIFCGTKVPTSRSRWIHQPLYSIGIK
jgi:hypothetical protein